MAATRARQRHFISYCRAATFCGEPVLLRRSPILAAVMEKLGGDPAAVQFEERGPPSEKEAEVAGRARAHGTTLEQVLVRERARGE